MLESKVQSKLIKSLEQNGWYVLKLIKTNKNGIPDLIALKPDDVMFFEVKRKGEKASKLQQFRIKMLKKLGFKAEIFGS